MVVIKKIKLDMIEKNLEDVVVLCSQVKVSQEELRYVESKIADDRKDFSSGSISRSLFNSKKNILTTEEKKLNKKIKMNIRDSLKRLQTLKKFLNDIEI